MKELFLDANAHISPSKIAIEAYNEAAAKHYGHPSSPKQGRNAANALETARESIAKSIGAENSSQIIFTSTCSESAEWACYLLFNLTKKENVKVICNPIEHPAIRESYLIDCTLHNQTPIYLKVSKDGEVQPHTNTTDKIICIGLHNELGVINDPKKLNVSLCDLSQNLGKVKVNLKEDNVDFAIFGGHKFGGMSIGFMYIKDLSNWKPFGSGSRYSMDRAGSPDVCSIIATAKALEDAIITLPERQKKMAAFQNKLESGLKELDIKIIGEGAKNRSPNTTFIYLPNAIELLFKLDNENIYVGTGSACGSSTSTSRTIQAIGGFENAQPTDFIRFSQFGDYDEENAEYLVKKIKELI